MLLERLRNRRRRTHRRNELAFSRYNTHRGDFAVVDNVIYVDFTPPMDIKVWDDYEEEGQ